MSFDFSPNINLSNVQASHKSTDGGAGNTGYFQRGNDESSQSLFKKEDLYDTFSSSAKLQYSEEEDLTFFELIKKYLYLFINKILAILNLKK